jgi:hypothetical protein
MSATDTSSNHVAPSEGISRAERTDRILEVIVAIMMGIVAVATAWSGYQAARWGGEQSTLYSRAGALRTESVRASNQAFGAIQLDVGLFTQWVNATAQDRQDLADFYRARFRPEFEPAFEAWLATDPINNEEAPASPFYMPEYVVSSSVEAESLETKAAETFEQGETANEQADDYVLTAVLLASVLFFAGIASGFDWPPVQIAVISVGFVLLVWGLYNLATYPIL